MIIPVMCAFGLWYLYYGVQSFLNGGSIGRDPLLMPFQCFWEELLWQIPGGTARKIAYVRENVVGDGDGVVLGNTERWDYGEVRSQNLYAACARDVMPGAVGFWLTTVLVPAAGFAGGRLLLQPLVTYLLG